MYGFNKIKSKHLDFVIIDSQTSEIKLAIELNDNSHNFLKRKKRDEFLDQALTSAGIPIIWAKSPNDEKLKSQLDAILK